MSEKSKKNLNRGRNWVCVIYPESLPKDFEKIIQLSGLKCALSPLHDKDLNADDEEKKAHYHLIFCFENSNTYNVASKFTESLNGTIPQLLHNLRGYYRYFTHKDNPEKYQYDEKDIKVFNGFDIRDYCTPTNTEISQMKEQIFDLILGNDITEYSDLIVYLKAEQMKELFDCACNNTLLFDRFLSSRRNKRITIRTEF